MPLKHRHFLGIPVFVLLLGATAWGAGNSLRADISLVTAPAGEIIAEGADREFTLPGGIGGILWEDGILNDDGTEIFLRDGTVLVTSDGMTRLRAGDVIVSGFHGGFIASTSGENLSVAALTTPVLLQHDAFRFIVPVGMLGEWQADTLPSVSDLQIVADMRSGLMQLDAAILRDELEELAGLDSSPLPSVDQGVLSQEDRDRLLRLQEVLQSGDIAQARSLLEDDALRQMLHSDTFPTAVLPPLLVSAAALPSIAQDLLTETQSSDLWLLASFHPDFASAAWETPGPVTQSPDLPLLRWLQLPSSDVGSALPVRIVDRWTAQLQLFLNGQDPPARAAFLHALLTTMRDYRTFVESREFPERLQRYAGALQEIVGPFVSTLSRDDQDLYAPWKNIDAIAPYSEPPAAVVKTGRTEPEPEPPSAPLRAGSPVPETAPEPFDAPTIEAHTKQLLQSAGALFTTQTTIHAESARRVTVQNILFASATGESTYDVTFDPEKSEVSDIHLGNEPLPYALLLEAFGRWARGGKLRITP